MKNARKELKELLASENTPKTTLESLDFEYDDSYGLQYLFGTV